MINYPQEFLIACGIHRLPPEELLQQFVNRFRYSGLMCGAEDGTEHAVNGVVSDYIQSVDYDRDFFKADLSLHLKWLKKLNAVKDKHSELPEKELQSRINKTVKACKKVACTKFAQPTSVCVPGGYTLVGCAMILWCCVFSMA